MVRQSTPSRDKLDRELRICSYSRYSTDEQDPTSTADQHRANERVLKEMRIRGSIETISDEEISGEHKSRPGIDKVRAGIRSKQWDVLISEDSSRPFRHPTYCLEFVEMCVDAGVRVIYPGDDVDTNEEGWQERLLEAQSHHARSNTHTRKRIKRKHRGLWEIGAALGKLRPGYSRTPTQPATQYEPAKGPFFDTIDPESAQIVEQAFRRIADRQPPWLVGRWLEKQKLRGWGKSASPSSWIPRRVIQLIRQTIYRGLDRHRLTVAQRRFSTGRSVPRRANEEEVWVREMPHQRIVSDDLWHAANDALDARNRKKDAVLGPQHPLFGIPRDSRGPLSQLFVCGICGAKMSVDGRLEGGYRCSNVRRGLCWNKATALRQLTHEAISQVIVETLLSSVGCLEAFVSHVSAVLQDEDKRQTEERELLRREKDLARKCENLATSIENSEVSPETLVKNLALREKELRQVRAELNRLRSERGALVTAPDRAQIESVVKQISHQLLSSDPQVRCLLEQLIPGKILAVPYQQYATNKVVLRAEFNLQLAGLLPAQLLAGLEGRLNDFESAALQTKSVSIDLFKASIVTTFALEAVSLKPGYTLQQLAKRFGISRRLTHLAYQLGRQMMAEGVLVPFRRLDAPPANASRWRTHAMFQTASESSESSEFAQQLETPEADGTS